MQKTTQKNMQRNGPRINDVISSDLYNDFTDRDCVF